MLGGTHVAVGSRCGEKYVAKTTSGPGTLRPFPSPNKNDPKDHLYKQVIAIIIGGPPTGRTANNIFRLICVTRALVDDEDDIGFQLQIWTHKGNKTESRVPTAFQPFWHLSMYKKQVQTHLRIPTFFFLLWQAKFCSYRKHDRSGKKSKYLDISQWRWYQTAYYRWTRLLYRALSSAGGCSDRAHFRNKNRRWQIGLCDMISYTCFSPLFLLFIIILLSFSQLRLQPASEPCQARLLNFSPSSLPPNTFHFLVLSTHWCVLYRKKMNYDWLRLIDFLWRS